MIYNDVSQWVKNEGEEPIVLSSRVRLARNLDHVLFPTVASANDFKVVQDYVHPILSSQYDELSMKDVTAVERLMLVEKHLISPTLTKNSEGSVYISKEEDVSIMVNEEDHIRIQTLSNTLDIEALYNQALAIDQEIDQEVNYAFDEKLGYLTSCPTNLGTGLRASVMLHLPALAMLDKMPQLNYSIQRFGFLVRGIFGEGSRDLGHVYQISNQVTLGKTEQDIIDDLIYIVHNVIDQEKEARQALYNHYEVQLEDQFLRSYGILKYSKLIDLKEASQRLSEVKLAYDLGMIETKPFNFHEMMVKIQPAFIRYKTNENENLYRAQLIQQHLTMKQ